VHRIKRISQFRASDAGMAGEFLASARPRTDQTNLMQFFYDDTSGLGSIKASNLTRGFLSWRLSPSLSWRLSPSLQRIAIWRRAPGSKKRLAARRLESCWRKRSDPT